MKCRICGNEHGNQEYSAREMMYGTREIFTYFLCADCGCLQIQEFPANISQFYRSDYYSHNSMHRPNFVVRFLIHLRDNYAVFSNNILGKLLYAVYPETTLRSLFTLNLNKKSYILDVGCGAGFLLHSLQELGFINLLGIDPFITADITYKNGLNIRKQHFKDTVGEWDLIMFHHSFEHLPDPVASLKSTFRLLKSNGRCLIKVPIVSSYAWDYYRTDWVQLDAPRHFFIFSVECVKRLCALTGFELFDIVFDSTAFQFWGSEQYKKNIPLYDDRSYATHPKNSIFSKKELANFEKRAKELNAIKRGDQAFFYLRKQ